MNKTELEKFVSLVDQMRVTQRRYFKKREYTLLDKCKELEDKVDDAIVAYYDRQKVLFK